MRGEVITSALCHSASDSSRDKLSHFQIDSSRVARGVLFRSIVFVVAVVFAGICPAEVYQLTACHTRGSNVIEDQGTAVCIATNQSSSLLITTKHTVEHGGSVWVAASGQWLEARGVESHPTMDVASLIVDAVLEASPIADDSPVGAEVLVVGYGGKLNNTVDPLSFPARIVDDGYLIGEHGEHAIPGDSGGPVYARLKDGRECCVGIVSMYTFDGMSPSGHISATNRRQYASKRARTGFVKSKVIYEWCQRRYGGCANGICPIQIRQHIQQPMIGIGIPYGQPRIVNEAVPYNPPQVYTPAPVPQPTPRPTPDPISVVGARGPAGPKGDRGEPGPPGKDGADGRSVRAEEIEATIVAWLESNRDALKGEPGLTGPAGRSIDKADIQIAVNQWLDQHATEIGSTPPVDLSGLEARLAALEQRKIRIVTSSGKQIVDDETFSGAQDDPIVLNIDKIVKTK